MFKLLLLSIFIIVIGCADNSHANTTQIITNKDTITFSKLLYTDTLKISFWCYNKSKDDIKIKEIQNGCGCISTLFEDSIIKPHDSLRINIAYVPMQSNDSGKIAKIFSIRSNADIPFHNIILKGEVIK